MNCPSCLNKLDVIYENSEDYFYYCNVCNKTITPEKVNEIEEPKFNTKKPFKINYEYNLANGLFFSIKRLETAFTSGYSIKSNIPILNREFTNNESLLIVSNWIKEKLKLTATVILNIINHEK